MNTLINVWFNEGLASYLLVMLTLLIIYMAVMSGVRVIFETAIPACVEKSTQAYYTTKKSVERAVAKTE